jgi:deoxyribodipyrimidine photo-lyase
MQRTQRGVDNSALNLAIEIGSALGLTVLAAFGLTADYPDAQRRHYRFLLDGLGDAARNLERPGIPLVVRRGRPDDIVNEDPAVVMTRTSGLSPVLLLQSH